MGTMASQIISLTIVYYRLFRRRSKKHQSSAPMTFVTDEFLAQMASNAENVSIWWRHHDWHCCIYCCRGDEVWEMWWSIFHIWQLVLNTHWGRVAHICLGNITIIDSDNGLSPGRRQAITWTNAGILLIRTLGTLAKFMHFHSRKCIWKCRLRYGCHFVSASMY